MGRKPSHQSSKALSWDLCSQLKRMFFGRIVVETGERGKARHLVNEQIALGRMQVAARRIASERPADLAGLFPGRNGQGILKEARQGANGDRSACDSYRTIQCIVVGRERRVGGVQW